MSEFAKKAWIFIIYAILGMIVTVVIMHHDNTTAIPDSYYANIKVALVKTCPVLQSQVQKFIENDGIFDMHEHAIFVKACTTINKIQHPPRKKP